MGGDLWKILRAIQFNEGVLLPIYDVPNDCFRPEIAPARQILKNWIDLVKIRQQTPESGIAKYTKPAGLVLGKAVPFVPITDLDKNLFYLAVLQAWAPANTPPEEIVAGELTGQLEPIVLPGDNGDLFRAAHEVWPFAVLHGFPFR